MQLGWAPELDGVQVKYCTGESVPQQWGIPAWERMIYIPTKPPFSWHYPHVLCRRWQAIHDYFGPVIRKLDVFDVGDKSHPRLFSMGTNCGSKLTNCVAGRRLRACLDFQVIPLGAHIDTSHSRPALQREE